jgi:hypothetical protein
MAPENDSIPIRFKNRVYALRPDFSLIREIEQELDGLPALREKFTGAGWTISELVTLTQILLQAAGETVDYLHLGNQMLQEGLGRHLSSVRTFLHVALQDGNTK